ncbi:hypothetical protein GBAR_LOCUS3206, partial [Geodia barretti]
GKSLVHRDDTLHADAKDGQCVGLGLDARWYACNSISMYRITILYILCRLAESHIFKWAAALQQFAVADFTSVAVEDDVEAEEIQDSGEPDTESDWEEHWEEDPHTGREEEGCSKRTKNKKERERMRCKKKLLEELESLLKRSNLISESDKKKRFTEAFTVSKTRLLLQELERKCGGRKRIYHRPVGHTPVRKKRKAPNSFLTFSARYRPCFVHVLKEAAMMVQETEEVKNPSQTVVQKLAARVWRRLQDKETESVETIKCLARDCVNQQHMFHS